MLDKTLVWIAHCCALLALLVPTQLWAQKFAFVSERDGNTEIYVVNADGSGETNLTNNPASDYAPRWSPDGSRILFVSDRSGNADVYVMNADGSGQTNLTNSPDEEISRGWSPDGSRILYTKRVDRSSGGYEYDGLYLVNADGSSPVQLSQAADISNAKWDPSGARILFTTVFYGNHLFVVNADGSGEKLLWPNPGDGAPDPQWSPDGTQILLSSDNTEDYRIYTVDLNGNKVGLTSFPAAGGNFDPVWSPDGTKIAFVSDRAGYFQLLLMNADGTDQTPIYSARDSDEWIGPASWSPAGDKILFSGGYQSRSGNWHSVVDLTGTVTDVPILGTWTPDGTRIYSSYGELVKADGRDLIDLGAAGDYDFQPFGDFSLYPTPAISDGGVVLANLVPAVNTVSPLSIVSIFGTAFSAGSTLYPNLDANGEIDTILGGTCVVIGHELVPIFAVTPTQVNVQMLSTEHRGPLSVEVVRNCGQSDQTLSRFTMVTVEEASPAFFLYPPYSADGLIAARFSDGYAAVAPEGIFSDHHGPSRPARPGDVILLFGTGWGPTTTRLSAGQLAAGAASLLPSANPMVTFGGLPLAAQDVLYVGVTPEAAGLYQLAIRVPATALPGPSQVVLTVYGKSTPTGPVVPVSAP